jgi:excisionase family DNA binding protein
MTAIADSPRLRSLKEVGERLNSSPATIYRLLSAGSLKAVKIGRRTFVSDESLAQFIAARPEWCRQSGAAS